MGAFKFLTAMGLFIGQSDAFFTLLTKLAEAADAPGATKTPIWKRGTRANDTAEQSAKLADFVSSSIALGRWGEPEKLAKAVLFLASDDSSYINALELMGDGGMTGAPFRSSDPSRLIALAARFAVRQIMASSEIGDSGSVLL
jgi:hypothetical protein